MLISNCSYQFQYFVGLKRCDELLIQPSIQLSPSDNIFSIFIFSKIMRSLLNTNLSVSVCLSFSLSLCQSLSSPSLSLSFSLYLSISFNIHLYIYIYICVCVCVFSGRWLCYFFVLAKISEFSDAVISYSLYIYIYVYIYICIYIYIYIYIYCDGSLSVTLGFMKFYKPQSSGRYERKTRKMN